ncbi:MAG: hypothetical protein ISS23_03965 [Nanoarchaeota archaeon]|nr:hypothetical protein [Nanoarchaeota archaeon]
MYISDLVENHGYKLAFKMEKERTMPYFGVDTLRKVIYLFNTRQGDVKNIEGLLLNADLAYSRKGRYV